MTVIQVYLLSAEDAASIDQNDRYHPYGPVLIICDHGLGICVRVDDINDPTFLVWKNSLEAILPFSSRTITDITIEEEI